MPLEVKIEKRLAEFALAVDFHAGDAPLSILGASGAGKTMLLRCIAGLEKPERGRIVLNGQTLFDSERGICVPPRERGVGMLFQNYALFPHKTVAENIAFALSDIPQPARSDRVADLSAKTHVASLGERFASELSGGEQQRVALARVLAIEPKALLFDEPLSAMDTHLRSRIETLLQEIFETRTRPALVVTHNIEEAYRLSAEMLVMSRGRVVAHGAKADIFRKPADTEVARLTGCKNISRARVEANGRVTALGWGVALEMEDLPIAAARFVGIRAHEIEFLDVRDAAAPRENVIPCWLARISETPFRMTVFLRTRELEKSEDEIELQAELTKETWNRVRALEQPWPVRLAPEHLFLMEH
jgi:ABC-type sulfate/molybdate transport systems ATPase subunit